MPEKHPELDLQRSIRPGLDILANEIVIALKKRTRFPVNRAVYEPGLVLGKPQHTLLEHALGSAERTHAELGRFTFADQEPFTDVTGVAPIIDRPAPDSPIVRMPSGIGPRLVDFHRGWIERACAPGDDSGTYGETVTADVAALLCIMERVTLGKFVAESKYLEAPERFAATGGDRDGIVGLIRRRDREGEVFELARRLAAHYELAPDSAVEVFEFMVEVTIDIEVDYIRRRLT